MTTESNVAAKTLAALQEANERGGAKALFATLITTLCDQQRFAEVFDVLQMQTRHDHGLPLIGNLDLVTLAPSMKSTLDAAFTDACRRTGELFLEAGDIAGAWPYFHKLQEFEPVATALDNWSAVDDPDTPVDVLVQIGYAQGANPPRGYELLLAHRGTCDAISMLEQGFPFGPSLKAQCIALLVRHFEKELCTVLVRQLGDDGQPEDAELSLVDLMTRHGERVTGACPLDDSHLQAVLRFSVELTDAEDLAVANSIAEFAAQIAPTAAYREGSPFQDFYRDYRVLLRALAGVDVDAGVEHFRAKTQLEGATPFAVEVFVYLLWRVGRSDEALATFRDKLLEAAQLRISPNLYELSAAAGNGDALQGYAEAKGNIVEYAVGLLI